MCLKNLLLTLLPKRDNLTEIKSANTLQRCLTKTFFSWKQIGTLVLVTTLLFTSYITYSQTMPYPEFISTGNLDQDSAKYKADLEKYTNWKLSQIAPAPQTSNARTATTTIGTQALAANCIIPRDASWTQVPTNDDGFLGPINLGFTFNLYGSSYNQAWINTNGNLTFTQGYSPYTPSGFPFNVPMVAAFWADEDTRPQCGGTGIIYYKLEATRLLVTWENVGYYNQHCDKTVTFQMIIGTQSDPVLSATGIGNNVIFNYGDMNWTTGDASNGVGGFGGAPSTVGANKGDGVNYVQVGRFDHPGTDYDGGGGGFDGVDYLDNKCFSFNVSSGGGNIPPSFSGLPVGNTVNIQVGVTVNYVIQIIGPEINQSVTTTVNINGLCGITATITNGLVSTINLSITGLFCNIGTHTIVITSTDNGSPAVISAVNARESSINAETPEGTTQVVLTINVEGEPGCENCYFSKSSGDLHNVSTWGLNPDGSGTNPPDFGTGKTFMLANRPSTYALTADWAVGGTLNIPSASDLQIQGFTLSVADIAGAGSFNGTTNSNLIVTQPAGAGTSLNFSAAANNLKNLTISSAATTTLASPLNIYGVLTSQSGTFNTANALTLKSTAVNTASVAPVTGIITGNVTVERYIPARRAWRVMSAPVGGSQTINAAWQEGATTSSVNPNPKPGYGTHITEGNAASGFDHNPALSMTSIKTYISSIDTWVPLLGTNTLHVNNDAYLLFVRGDRGVPLGYNDVPATPTTLRATGPLKTGDQLFPVNATGFTAIPNPFASPIDFASLTKTNVQDNFYLWDPKMGGENGVGGYVLLSFNGTSYEVIPASVSPESQYIQSGQGFLVHSTGAPGSILIQESNKTATPAADVFRVAANPSGNLSNKPSLRINLQSVNDDNTTSLLDEALLSYGTNFSDKVDNLDAQKMANIEENLAIVRGGQLLMVDRSTALDEKDTIQLKLWNTASKKRYLFTFNPDNLSATVPFAYLVDKYLKTSTPVSLNKKSQLYFTVNDDAASSNPGRFTVVFNEGSLNTVSINNSNGIQTYPNPVHGKDIQLMFNNQPGGTYKVEMVNGIGQVIYRSQIKHAGGSAIQKIQLTNKPATGVYMLNITNASLRNTIKIIVD